MKAVRILLVVAVAWMAAGCLSCGGRADLPSGFVHVTERVPDAILEIRYHSTYNFVGKRIDGYDAPEAILTEEAAAALRKASDALKERGYRLKIYDAYRPQRAVDHFMRWAADRNDVKMRAVFYPELDKSVLFDQGYIAAKSGHRGAVVRPDREPPDSPRGDGRRRVRAACGGVVAFHAQGRALS